MKARANRRTLLWLALFLSPLMYSWSDFVFEVKVALGVIGICVAYNWLTAEEEEEEEEDMGSHRPWVGWGVPSRDTGSGSEHFRSVYMNTGSGHWWGEQPWDHTIEEYERWERERYSWEGHEWEEEQEEEETYILRMRHVFEGQ